MGIVLSAGETVNFDSQNTLTVNSDGLLEFEASGSGFSHIRGHSNDINLNAVDQISYTSSVEFEARSQGSMTFTGASVSVDGQHSHMTAQDEDFRLTATNFNWVNTPFIIMEATGHESLFDLHPNTLDLVATRATYINADETFSAAFENVVATASFDSTSAHDTNFVVENGGLITFTASNSINFRAIDDGSVIANIAGDMTTVSSNSDITFLAEGMLGALGGRYVLEDQYWLPEATTDNRHRINRNTFGIEVTNNDADLDLTAVNQGGNIRFFGIGANALIIPGTGGVPPASPPSGGPAAPDIPDRLTDFAGNPMVAGNGYGQLPRMPFAFETDYCTGRQCSINGVPVCNVVCPNISRVINEVASALVRYGLIDCLLPNGTSSGFCINP